MGAGKRMVRKSEIIISNPKYKNFDSHIQLMRITLTNKESKFDFGYKADDYYHRGGWIKINPATFLRTKDKAEIFKLINATNIPYGPERYHFNSTIEWKYFSLYFPPIPDHVQIIDLIEEDSKLTDPTQFNFYSIHLSELRKQELLFRDDF